MDRARTRALLLGAGVAAAGALGAFAAETPTLRAAAWTAPGPGRPASMSRRPTECLALPADPAARASVEVGRAAFRTPLVLGGQAARAGLSCESCHRSGRGAPDFVFPGVSGPPGTADVTHSLFSSKRGNGRDDPKPIPDLSVPKTRLAVDQRLEAAALEPFIRGLVVEEFDGPMPTPAVLAGLADYIRALDPAACPDAASEPQSPARHMADARRALAAAGSVLHAGDRATALVMVAAARAQLFLIDERYAAPDLASLRARVRVADRELNELQRSLRAGGPDAQARLDAWTAAAHLLEADLAARSDRSLYDPRRLARALGQDPSLPPPPP